MQKHHSLKVQTQPQDDLQEKLTLEESEERESEGFFLGAGFGYHHHHHHSHQLDFKGVEFKEQMERKSRFWERIL